MRRVGWWRLGAGMAMVAALAPMGCREHGTAPPAKWQVKANWKQIRPGMTAEQVRGILGEPTRIQTDLSFSNWEYGEGEPGGKVMFAGGILKDWHSPQ